MEQPPTACSRRRVQVGACCHRLLPRLLFAPWLLPLPFHRLPETWAAFRRYTNALLAYNEDHPLRVPKPVRVFCRIPSRLAPPHRNGLPPAPPSSCWLQGRGYRDYFALDADLVAWHTGFGDLVDRASSMAVVRPHRQACAACQPP